MRSNLIEIYFNIILGIVFALIFSYAFDIPAGILEASNISIDESIAFLFSTMWCYIGLLLLYYLYKSRIQSIKDIFPFSSSFLVGYFSWIILYFKFA